MFAAVEHDFVDETPQQRFALSIGRSRVGPDLRQAAGEADNLALQRLVYPDLNDRVGTGLVGKRFFGRPNLGQRRFPATLEFGGDETIIGVHPIELALRKSGGISLSFEFALGACAKRRVHLVLGAAGLRQRIEFGRRQRRQEGVRDSLVDPRCSHLLAGRQPLIGAQVIAYVLASALVADEHLVPASGAPGDAVQEKFAVARRAASS